VRGVPVEFPTGNDVRACATPAAIAHELASARARLGWNTRRLREAERLAAALIDAERSRALLAGFEWPPVERRA
jgi:hypothetical protein